MNKAIKWAAKLAHVQEVSLLGTADLRFWARRLQTEDLQPAERDGQAQIMIVAADAKYMGLRFQELSFSVVVRPQSLHTSPNAAYLVGAFNSSAFFAFCERVFFSTPYEHGRVTLSTSPAAIDLFKDNELVFRVGMGDSGMTTQREPLSACDDGWEGTVILPNKARRKGRPGKLFFARLRGYTKVYPFVVGTDSLAIESTAESPVLSAIRDAQFVAMEWVIRENATHAKSKTYNRVSYMP